MAKREYKAVLPFNRKMKVMDQFGWLPLSVIEPTKASKEAWKDKGAYIPQIEDEKRRGDDAKYLPGLGFSEFHAGLCETIVKYWSLKGAKVVDPFMGRATRAVVTKELGRDYEGYEISPTTHKRVKEHLESLKLDATLWQADGCKLANTKDNSVDLVMTCPPYWNIEKYEKVDGQLSALSSYAEFMKQIDTCGENINRVLKAGAFCCWVCGDFRSWSGDGVFYPFHADTIASFKKAGLIFHDLVVIKNQSPFAPLQAGKVAAKRYTSKVHEYLLVFRKEGEYEVPSYCTTNETDEFEDIFTYKEDEE